MPRPGGAPCPAPPPTALTTMSSRPKRSTVSATIRSASASSVASAVTVRPSEPAARTRCQRRVGGFAGPADDRHPCPGARERLGDRRADPAAATRDQGHPTLEAEDVELAQSVSSRDFIDYRTFDPAVHDRVAGRGLQGYDRKRLPSR